uniref:hypothetical protein n=1 Tax=Tessaracoccus timonensis TaxID=2161816 RepID=UPI0018D52475|nr:hypothetical protein [Tessaracoccus timonensis]
MGGVGGEALGAVGVDGVAEVDVLSHVVGGEDDAVAEPGPGWADRDRSIVTHGGDGPGLAVADPTVPVPQSPVVAAGDDRVPHARCRSVGQGDFGAGLQRAVEDEVGAGADVEGGVEKATDRDPDPQERRQRSQPNPAHYPSQGRRG